MQHDLQINEGSIVVTDATGHVSILMSTTGLDPLTVKRLGGALTLVAGALAQAGAKGDEAASELAKALVNTSLDNANASVAAA